MVNLVFIYTKYLTNKCAVYNHFISCIQTDKIHGPLHGINKRQTRTTKVNQEETSKLIFQISTIRRWSHYKIFDDNELIASWQTERRRYQTRPSQFCTLHFCCFQLHRHSDHYSVYTREMHAITIVHSRLSVWVVTSEKSLYIIVDNWPPKWVISTIVLCAFNKYFP